MPSITDIAQICHEANRAYCRTLGDRSHLPWDETPLALQTSAIDGVVYALEHRDARPGDQHLAWMRGKVADGWVWGPEKSTLLKTHPCLIPFEELPEAQQRKDKLFLAIVRCFQ